MKAILILTVMVQHGSMSGFTHAPLRTFDSLIECDELLATMNMQAWEFGEGTADEPLYRFELTCAPEGGPL